MDSPLAPVWLPSEKDIARSNVAWLMDQTGTRTWEELHGWSVQNREAYWRLAIERLGLRFQRPFSRVADFSRGPEHPAWLPGARLNIVESCLAGPPDDTVIFHQEEGGEMQRMTRGELAALAGRIATGLVRFGCQPGDRIALFMPMTARCVAIYLGVVQAGCVVVSIADSFRPPEIATRLQIASASVVFTHESVRRGGKSIPLYPSLLEANAPRTVVLHGTAAPARPGDVAWEDFLPAQGENVCVERNPDDALNILFSSGTTGEPKAIPWTQTTPIKCAADAHFHQDVHPGDVLVWPTNVGWMMGPWLIFAALLNRAALGLYQGLPAGEGFGQFVQMCGATLLGVIPTLVKTWRATDCFQGCDLSALRAFSSTGECSCADDMHWLMAQAGGRPVIEYCGGTEVGGGYLTSVVTRPNVPGVFNAKALGLDFVIVDDEGSTADEGEVFLLPPSMGLSTTLLNRDHHEAYHAGTPSGPSGETLRRHGDRIRSLPGGNWSAQGRADDTMNLGGIKVSSAEIERTLQSVPGLRETAAVAVAPGGGPELLVVFAVVSDGEAPARQTLRAAMQEILRRDLNPLFKIHDVVLAESLPRTASNKVLRRVLRDRYQPVP